MATIEEMNSKMTVIYNTRTGSLKGIYTGIQDFNVLFGNEAQDYASILTAIVLDKDSYVMKNWKQFKYNSELNKLELINPPDISKYM